MFDQNQRRNKMMKKIKLKRGLVALLLVLVLFLGACGNGDDPEPEDDNDNDETAEVTPESDDEDDEDDEDVDENGESDQITITVGWWGGDVRHERTIAVIELFEELHPHITVEPVFAGWDDYWTLLNTHVAGGSLPDVIQMDVTRITEWAESDLIIGLNDLINSGHIDLSDVDPSFQEVLQIDGENMAINLGANGFAMVYNTELAAELGFEFTPDLTWDEWAEFLTATRAERGDDFYGWGMGAEYEIFNVYVRDAGYAMYEGEGLGFDKPVLVEFFEMVEMFNDTGIAVTPQRGEGVEDGELLHGEVILSEMFASNQIIGVQNSVEAELGLALLPRVEGGRGGNWIRASMGFSITGHSQHPEEAAMFIDFFTNNLEANEILAAERGAPISSVVMDHLRDTVDPVVVRTFDILPVITANSSPADPIPPAGQADVRLAFLRAVEELRFGIVSPDEAADYVISAAEDVFQ